jgi:hypothetical protein
MKTKLTLSIDRRKVAMLRKASARKGKSISELVENLAEKSDEQPAAEGEAEANILKWRGFWAKHVTDADFEADDRAGAELRKTKAYERRKHEKQDRA